ncbi:GntR family transcriptional regulator [Pseudodonghicola flavimaris]|uniref:FCD domain-containing protein n=1 Tax=Pseudodonghicola flavimaris TaxID=3050036 RepID=A0ABT7F136_9RHOB|nr:GntR family transcriptional regulator [Pseudodonghicola flavimaris]MDK3018215.1 FCD domain-containing protein [Pseudodonghicola flavimaris]
MTLSNTVYEKLRADIIDGLFAPHQPLRLEQLKQQYGVGFSPLREALNRLQGERLVVSALQRGFRVSSLSVEEMWDAVNSRIFVEGEALRRSIGLGDDDWEAALVASFHALSIIVKRLGQADREIDKDSFDELERRHREFHAALISACGSAWLLDFAEKLNTETERYRVMALRSATLRHERDVEAEHKAILEATLRRDADAASGLLRDHYHATGQFLERVLRDRVARAS